MIEGYVDELGRALPRVARARRSRILREVASHLNDAAGALERGGMPRAAAEAEAIRRFGAATSVASEFAPLLVASALRRAAGWLLAGLVLALPAAYGLSENLLPPATWPTESPPFELRWKVGALAALLVVAGFAALVSVLLARPRRLSLALVPAAATAVSLAAAVLVAVALAVEWSSRVPGAGGAFVAAILAAGALVAPGTALAAVAVRAVVVERRRHLA